MSTHVIAGCDLSDRSMVVQWAVGGGPPQKKTFSNDAGGRQAMFAFLRERAEEAGGAQTVFACEAGPHGFGLHGDACEEGAACRVLAPTKMPGSPKRRKNKTDEKDAPACMEALRGHLLAGNSLPPARRQASEAKRAARTGPTRRTTDRRTSRRGRDRSRPGRLARSRDWSAPVAKIAWSAALSGARPDSWLSEAGIPRKEPTPSCSRSGA